jgi:hypothetical protein
MEIVGQALVMVVCVVAVIVVIDFLAIRVQDEVKKDLENDNVGISLTLFLFISQRFVEI